MFIEIRRPNFKVINENPLIDQFKKKHQNFIIKIRNKNIKNVF